MHISISKGMNLPVSGEPEQTIHEAPPVNRVAVLGADYIGLKPEFLVKEGQSIKAGQILFADKKSKINYTAPASGLVKQINWGPRHTLQSVEIAVQGDTAESFPVYSEQDIRKLSADEIRSLLLKSGLWAAFRARPFSTNPHPDSQPNAIFITAMDSNPLAADPSVVIKAYENAFTSGLALLTQFFEGPVFLCRKSGAAINAEASRQLEVVDFSGPHPSGLVGTHIHLLHPVGENNSVWHLGYQDVIAMGKLALEGRLWTQRIISVAGPGVLKPRLLRTRLGANLLDLLQGQLTPGNNTIISGSVLSGRHVFREEAYLGRYHLQATVLDASEQSVPTRSNMFSVDFSLPDRVREIFKDQLTLAAPARNERRVLYPLGDFERLLPFDVLPTPLLKALLAGDDEEALLLGCLELDEEDLALCSYACCNKNAYGDFLRASLDRIAGSES